LLTSPPDRSIVATRGVTIAKLKTVGVREFRDHVTTYLSGFDPAAVSKHGRVVGSTSPLGGEDKVRRALTRLRETVSQVLDETGLLEEELAQMFDMRRRHQK
jgi:hypothetical protein